MGGSRDVGMEVHMDGGQEEIVVMREHLRQLRDKVEHNRRRADEQLKSLANLVPDLLPSIELSLKVSGVFFPSLDMSS